MSTISLSISYKIEQNADTTYGLKVWVSSTELVPPYVFLVRELPDMPDENFNYDHFERVCTYADMINYGLATDDTRPWKRVSSLYFQFTSIVELNEILDSISTSLQTLLNEIQDMNKATPTTVVYTF